MGGATLEEGQWHNGRNVFPEERTLLRLGLDSSSCFQLAMSQKGHTRLPVSFPVLGLGQHVFKNAVIS